VPADWRTTRKIDDNDVRDEGSHNMLEVHVEETNCHGRVDLALVLTLCQK
jgi:hypothetical protein